MFMAHEKIQFCACNHKLIEYKHKGNMSTYTKATCVPCYGLVRARAHPGSLSEPCEENGWSRWAEGGARGLGSRQRGDQIRADDERETRNRAQRVGRKQGVTPIDA